MVAFAFVRKIEICHFSESKLLVNFRNYVYFLLFGEISLPFNFLVCLVLVVSHIMRRFDISICQFPFVSVCHTPLSYVILECSV